MPNVSFTSAFTATHQFWCRVFLCTEGPQKHCNANSCNFYWLLLTHEITACSKVLVPYTILLSFALSWLRCQHPALFSMPIMYRDKHPCSTSMLWVSGQSKHSTLVTFLDAFNTIWFWTKMVVSKVLVMGIDFEIVWTTACILQSADAKTG